MKNLSLTLKIIKPRIIFPWQYHNKTLKAGKTTNRDFKNKHAEKSIR